MSLTVARFRASAYSPPSTLSAGARAPAELVCRIPVRVSSRFGPAERARHQRCLANPKGPKGSRSDTAKAAPSGPTGTARVDVGTAIEQITVPLLYESNKVLTSTLVFPLGLVLEESENGIVVVDITRGGNADKAKVQEGDLLRGTTAAMMQMTYPTMNLMFGGGGRPKLVKVLLPTTGMPFPKCMDAVRSNRDLDDTITLVLERHCKPAPPAPPAAVSEGARTQGSGSVFDPRIFE